MRLNVRRRQHTQTWDILAPQLDQTFSSAPFRPLLQEKLSRAIPERLPPAAPCALGIDLVGARYRWIGNRPGGLAPAPRVGTKRNLRNEMGLLLLLQQWRDVPQGHTKV